MMMFVVVAVAVLTIACGGSLVAVVVLWRKVADLTVYTSQLEEGIARAFGQHDDTGQVGRRPQLRVVRGGGRYLAGVFWVPCLRTVALQVRDHPVAASAASLAAATALAVPLALAPDVRDVPARAMPERPPEASQTVAPQTGRTPTPRVSPSRAATVDTGDRSNRRETQPAAAGDGAEPSPRPTPVEVEVEATTPAAPEPDDEVLPPMQVPRQPPDDDGCVVGVPRLACVDALVELDAAA